MNITPNHNLNTLLRKGREHITLKNLRHKKGLTGVKGDYKFNDSMMRAISKEATYPINQFKIVDIKEDRLILDIPLTFKRWSIRLTTKQYSVEKNSLFTLDAGA